jgi:hypothetical protein
MDRTILKKKLDMINKDILRVKIYDQDDFNYIIKSFSEIEYYFNRIECESFTDKFKKSGNAYILKPYDIFYDVPGYNSYQENYRFTCFQSIRFNVKKLTSVQDFWIEIIIMFYQFRKRECHDSTKTLNKIVDRFENDIISIVNNFSKFKKRIKKVRKKRVKCDDSRVVESLLSLRKESKKCVIDLTDSNSSSQNESDKLIDKTDKISNDVKECLNFVINKIITDIKKNKVSIPQNSTQLSNRSPSIQTDDKEVLESELSKKRKSLEEIDSVCSKRIKMIEGNVKVLDDSVNIKRSQISVLVTKSRELKLMNKCLEKKIDELSSSNTKIENEIDERKRVISCQENFSKVLSGRFNNIDGKTKNITFFGNSPVNNGSLVECKICKSNPSSEVGYMVSIPCGHVDICKNCFSTVKPKECLHENCSCDFISYIRLNI